MHPYRGAVLRFQQLIATRRKIYKVNNGNKRNEVRLEALRMDLDQCNCAR